MPLTNTAIRHAKANGKMVKLFDGEGLYLHITKNNHKWWRFKYRFQGKEKLLSLGVYPTVSLKMARERKQAMRQLLAHGIDPSQHRKITRTQGAEQRQTHFETIAREWLTKYASHWSSTHTQKTQRRLERKVFPWIGKIAITELTAPQILAVVRRMEERGILESAHRTLRNYGQVFRYAVATGRAERDICADLKGALPPIKGQHFAAVVEPCQVRELLRAIDGYKGTLIVHCALQLAPLVFVRPGEKASTL